MTQYFPEPKLFGRRLKIELDLPNYATKADLKNVASNDSSKYAKNID